MLVGNDSVIAEVKQELDAEFGSSGRDNWIGVDVRIALAFEETKRGFTCDRGVIPLLPAWLTSCLLKGVLKDRAGRPEKRTEFEAEGCPVFVLFLHAAEEMLCFG
jgi:hypothetical protein